MRIDYRAPRNLSNMSVSSGKQRSSGSSPGNSAMLFVILAAIIFGGGFGTGWYFSQQSTKRAFRAAMEQKSLENSPKEERHPIPPPVATAPPAATLQPAAPVPTAAPASAAAAPAASQKPAPPPGLPLSFYENLPSGQKNTVLGSGINEKNKPTPPAAPAQQPAGTAPPKPDATPATTAYKPAAATGGWLVQVAALSSQKEAEALKAKLVAKGYSASIMETHLNDKGTWYRVRIGRRMSKEAATDIASRIGSGAKALPDQD